MTSIKFPTCKETKENPLHASLSNAEKQEME